MLEEGTSKLNLTFASGCLSSPLSVGLTLPPLHSDKFKSIVTLVVCLATHSVGSDSHRPVLWGIQVGANDGCRMQRVSWHYAPIGTLRNSVIDMSEEEGGGGGNKHCNLV